MYDPKFEKEMRRKMEELEFSPSEAVWANIEQAVGREKKRRRIPFFWLFFLSGMLLMGAGVVYWVSRPGAPAAAAAHGPAVSPVGPAVSPVNPAAPAIGDDAGRASKVKATDPVAVGAKERFGEAEGRSVAEGRGGKDGDIGHSGGEGRSEVGMAGRDRAGEVKERYGAEGKRELHARSGYRVTRNESGVTRSANGAARNESGVAGNENGVARNEYSVGQKEDETAGKGHGPIAEGEQGRQRYSYMPGLELLFRPAPRVTTAALTGQTNKTIQKTVMAVGLAKPKRPWEAAFTGGIGISSFKQSLPASSPSSSQNFYSANALVVPLPISTGNSTKNTPSDIQPGLSFSAGILARKPLSARWAVTVGLDLEYYSSRLRTGQLVNGYSPAPRSLLYAAAAAPVQTYPYYATGNENVFTNRYYALEIPGSVQWQITHSRVMPLFWEGGFSLSYMVSSDALYYNPHSGVYFKDNNVIDRTRFNLMTSLMVGLPLGGVRMQVGPHVEYGVTPLLKTSVSTGQHLFYGGIRFVIIPARGKK
jgi:hypothetical protein